MAMQSYNPELRNGWRKQLFAALSDLANIDKQREAWTDPDGASWHTWEAYYNEFFSLIDVPFDAAHYYRLGYLRDEESRLLSEFQAKAGVYEPPEDRLFDDRKILSDKAWVAVAKLAERTRDQLLACAETDEERDALMYGGPQMTPSGKGGAKS